MIKRIVKLTFQKDKVDSFRTIFDESKRMIINSPGCLHLELLQQIDQPNVFFTYSFWEDEQALNNYRHSDFFKSTWKKTKALFSNKPEAWSVQVVEEIVVE